MKAFILNSGLGKRMGDLTKDKHKSMVALYNGESVFERQIRVLSDCGVSKFIITTGPFKAQLIECTKQNKFKHLKFIFVDNPIYDKTNYIYSMYLALEYFKDDLLLLHGDLVFSEDLAKSIINDLRPSLGCVDKKKPLPEKDFKARLTGNRIKEISVKIFDKDCYAFQPFYKLSSPTVKKWGQKITEFIKAQNTGVYAENALNEILPLDLEAFSCEEYFVEEIDTPEDLKNVSRELSLRSIKK